VKPLTGLTHLIIALAMPILMVGLVNRTKSLWAGRKGPGLMQSGWDLWRLMHKDPVYSTVATPLFRAGPWVVLASTVLAAMIAPIAGSVAVLQFGHDFIFFAYTLGLARLFIMLSAMDVGSSFEGMGAAREASFTAYVEPALFLLVGSASVATDHRSFAALIAGLRQPDAFPWLVVPASVVLLILLQAEAARVPVDDPLTHLELTMVHEVMILDHSGPELAAMEYAAALKMTIYAGLIAALVNPFDPRLAPVAALLTSMFVMGVVALIVGCIESLVARLRMSLVPGYLVLASAIAALCLVASAWLGGGR